MDSQILSYMGDLVNFRPILRICYLSWVSSLWAESATISYPSNKEVAINL